jgi:hypothetical protein
MKAASHHKLSYAMQVQTSVEKRKDVYIAQIDVAASPELDDKEIYASW